MRQVVNDDGQLVDATREHTTVPDHRPGESVYIPNPDRFISKPLSVLAAGEPEPIPWIVDGLLVRGRVTILAAAMKVGKSLAALSLAADLALVASNTKLAHDAFWLGQQIEMPGPTLYMTAEGGELLVHHRAVKMFSRHEIDSADNLHVYANRPTPSLTSKDDLADIGAMIEKLGVQTLIIDPLGRFWTPEDEAKPLETQILFDALGDMAERLNVAILVVHHDGKSVPGEVTGGRGSGKIGDCADILINLKREGEDLIRMTSLSRWGDPPPPRVFEIHKESLRLVEADVVACIPPHYEEFIDALRRTRGWATRGQIVLNSPFGDGTFRKYAKEWVDYAGPAVTQSTDREIGGTTSAHVYALTEYVKGLLRSP